MPKTITLKPGDRATRDAMREAHDMGRHGAPDAPYDILLQWAGICSDCNARYHYEFGDGNLPR